MTSSTARAVTPSYEILVDGEVDIDTAGHLRAQLGQAMGSPAMMVVLDTSAVTFIDCSGLRELVVAQAKLSASGRTLHLRAPAAAVIRILELTGLSAAFGLPEDRPAVTGSARGLGIGGAQLRLVPPLTPGS